MRIALVAVASVVLLAGCATGQPASIAEASYPGYPPGVPIAEQQRPGVRWLDEPVFALTLLESPDCPAVPTAMSVVGDSLAIELSASGTGPCRESATPITYELTAPADAARPLTVVGTRTHGDQELGVLE
ncbi:hypothetical protein [Desertivibrio insolitus]|uniref:hypothetical protein n=1 Tax=Herbiconiux sp. SYSU D00978 TaxID=2812562 RepID=UPI001A978DF4|nr:hypothetical protein [Herbiconiux sp. SYSU D00978]